MSNFYEFKNRFVLVDVEGVLLSDPGDELIIREPINMGDTQITLERSPENHSVDFEFSDPEKPFGFHRVKIEGQPFSAYDLIQSIFSNKGVDGKCTFKIQHRRLQSFFQYERQAGEGNNIDSVAGFLRLKAVLDTVKVGDQLKINTVGGSTYNDNTYTVSSIISVDSSFSPGYSVFGVEETLPNSSYQGDWTVGLIPGFETPYTGELDFNTIDQVDKQINISSRRVNLDDKFRSRVDVPVNLQSNQTIDGAAIAPPTSQRMFLHSKVIQTNQNATSQDSPFFGYAEFLNISSYRLQLDYDSERTNEFSDPVANFRNGIGNDYGQGILSKLTELEPSELSPQYVFPKVRGVLKIDYTARYDLIVTNMNANTIEYLGTFINIDGVETQINNPQTFNSNSAFYVCELSFSHQGSYNINKGSEVKIYDKWTIPTNSNVNQTYRISVRDSHVMNMVFDAVADNSYADVYDPFSVFQYVISAISGKSSALISDFFQNVANRMYLTNGYLIRGFNKAERPPIVSFKTLFSAWAKPTFGLGFGVVESSGVQKILIDRYDAFYRSAEIDYIDEIENETWGITADREVHMNEVEIGYRDYPSATDENTQNNIDEFNTVHKLVTPLQTTKRKGEFISEVIASGYKVENQRREQFNDVPADTVSDDDNIFVIKGSFGVDYLIKHLPDNSRQVVIIDSAGFISLYGTYFDFEVGDDVTITRSDGFVLVSDENIDSIESNGAYTKIGVSAALQDGASTAHDWTVSIESQRLRAARDEEFESVTNVISPETSYNIGLNPKYMLLNQSLFINSGFNDKPNTDIVKTQQAVLNRQMTCQFKPIQGGYTLSGDSQVVQMEADLPLSQINQQRKLFTGRLIRFSAVVGFDRVMNIREKHYDYNTDEFNGYLRVKNPFGVDLFGFLMSMKYNPLSHKASFVLREKSTDVVLVTEYTHNLVIDFATSVLACQTTNPTQVVYGDTQTLVIGTTLYSTSQDPTGSLLGTYWVYHESTNRPIRLVDGVIAEFGSTCAPPPAGNKTASYSFQAVPISFDTQFDLNTTIKGFSYGETSATGINIGSTDTAIQASLQVTQSDLDNTNEGSVGITLQVFNGASDNPANEIGVLLSDSTTIPDTIQVSRVVTYASITGSEIYIKVTKSEVVPE